jgi:hypothetical protein
VTSAGSRAAACRSSTRGGPSRPRFRALGLPGHGERKASNAYGGTAGLPVTFKRPKLLASLSGPLPFFARSKPQTRRRLSDLREILRVLPAALQEKPPCRSSTIRYEQLLGSVAGVLQKPQPDERNDRLLADRFFETTV